MSSTVETGHAKNVANFENLMVCVMDYGARYAPRKAALQLPQLEALLSQAQQILSDVTQKRSAYKIAVNQRQVIFTNLNYLVTRVMASLNTTDADDKLIEDAKIYQRKLRGLRATPKIKSNDELNVALPPRNSVSQQSYTQKVQHFEGLISIINREPTFDPTEPDLQIASLENFKNTLSQKSRAVMQTQSQWIDARIQRDRIFYTAPNALVTIANAVKEEVKSIFGTNSPEYNKIKKCKFATLI